MFIIQILTLWIPDRNIRG